MANTREEKLLWVTGDFAKEDCELRRAVVFDGISQLTETRIEVVWAKFDVKLEEFLGKLMTIHLETSEGNERLFTGMVVSAKVVDIAAGGVMIDLELRPKLWLLTRRRNSRIFQNKTAPVIIDEILNDHGVSRTRKSTSETYQEREYCVQYRETDYDFICRLMEEEGMYFFFDHADSDGSGETLVIADGSGAHSALPETPKPEFFDRDASSARRGDHIFEMTSNQQITSGAVTLRDFDMETPSADLTVASNIAKGSHSYKNKENYDYPGHYRRDTGLGSTRARVRMEAEAVKFATWKGASTVRTMAVGGTFQVDNADNLKIQDTATDYLVINAVHFMQAPGQYTADAERKDIEKDAFPFPKEAKELYSNEFQAIPKTEPYRTPLTTPWPEISGLHTAIVTGPSGEEIWTDEHGRIKVQFHWDRDGQMDENTTCWVRVVTPWSGKNWGMVHVPRIGQEVVIQFEEGDPDRPICTGMLYNAETPPPYELPANATQSGIKSNSSKGGDGFNELMFEDKKDAELVRFQAEKDYEQIVKNNATITIGMEKQDAGDLTQTVFNHVTETIKEGNHTFTIEQGNQAITIEQGDQTFDINTGSQTVTIKTDQTETIEGKSTRTVTGDHSETIKQGNKETTVSLGNITVDASAGKITMTAAQSIELKVGSSSVKLDPSGVTVKGMMITVEGTAKADMKSPMTTVEGSGMLTLKGGLTMIN